MSYDPAKDEWERKQRVAIGRICGCCDCHCCEEYSKDWQATQAKLKQKSPEDSLPLPEVPRSH